MTPAAQLAEALAKPKKRAKFGNVPVIVDEIRFDSKAEARQWEVLKLRQRVGEISDLQRQVTFPLEVNGLLVCSYRADMTWRENGALVVADVKSAATRNEPSFRIKCKLLEALTGIKILVLA